MEDESAGKAIRDTLLVQLTQGAGVRSTPEALIREYNTGNYTGPAFDVYGENNPTAITSDDLIATTMLSIQVNENSDSSIRPTAILKLHAQSERITFLLSHLPQTRDLHTTHRRRIRQLARNRLARSGTLRTSPDRCVAPPSRHPQTARPQASSPHTDPRHCRRNGTRTTQFCRMVATLVAGPSAAMPHSSPNSNASATSRRART